MAGSIRLRLSSCSTDVSANFAQTSQAELLAYFAHMWGDLWEYPFHAATWGTVAEWVGSLLTGLGVLAAAIYYIYDKRVGAKAQARHIAFVRKGWTRASTTLWCITSLTNQSLM